MAAACSASTPAARRPSARRSSRPASPAASSPAGSRPSRRSRCCRPAACATSGRTSGRPPRSEAEAAARRTPAAPGASAARLRAGRGGALRSRPCRARRRSSRASGPRFAGSSLFPTVASASAAGTVRGLRARPAAEQRASPRRARLGRHGCVGDRQGRACSEPAAACFRAGCAAARARCGRPARRPRTRPRGATAAASASRGRRAAGDPWRCDRWCARCCWTGAAATTVVALTTATVAATFAAALPPTRSDLIAVATLPQSSARAMSLLLLGRLLEPARERAARAEDQRLDGGLRELELLRDLAVREALPLAQQDRAALALGHLLEHVLEADQLVGAPRRRRGQLLDHLEVGRRLDAAAPPARAAAREADVVGDLEEPRRLELRHDAALDPAERVQERALDGVLRLLPRAELVQAVAEDLVRVLLVEGAREVGFGRGDALDAVRTAYGRYCGQIVRPRRRSGKRAPPGRATASIIGETFGPGNPFRGDIPGRFTGALRRAAVRRASRRRHRSPIRRRPRSPSRRRPGPSGRRRSPSCPRPSGRQRQPERAPSCPSPGARRGDGCGDGAPAVLGVGGVGAAVSRTARSTSLVPSTPFVAAALGRGRLPRGRCVPVRRRGAPPPERRPAHAARDAGEAAAPWTRRARVMVLEHLRRDDGPAAQRLPHRRRVRRPSPRRGRCHRRAPAPRRRSTRHR